MSRRDLNRAVAYATGESIEAIERRGFQVVDAAQSDPLILDWDEAGPALLPEVLADEDWPDRVTPLPSHDEDLDDELCGYSARGR